MHSSSYQWIVHPYAEQILRSSKIAAGQEVTSQCRCLLLWWRVRVATVWFLGSGLHTVRRRYILSMKCQFYQEWCHDLRQHHLKLLFIVLYFREDRRIVGGIFWNVNATPIDPLTKDEPFFILFLESFWASIFGGSQLRVTSKRLWTAGLQHQRVWWRTGEQSLCVALREVSTRREGDGGCYRPSKGSMRSRLV